MTASGGEIKDVQEKLRMLTEEVAYMKGDDIALVKRFIQLHIFISRQKREDAKLAALLVDEEDDEEEGYKYSEPSVADVEKELFRFLQARMQTAGREERIDIMELLSDIKLGLAEQREYYDRQSSDVTNNQSRQTIPEPLVRAHSADTEPGVLFVRGRQRLE